MIGSRKIACTVLMGLFWLAVPGVCAAQPRPLNAPNRMPLSWIFLDPGPMGVDLPMPGALTFDLALDYSALYLNRRSESWYVLMDMEVAAMNISATYSLASRWAIGMTLPVVGTHSGILDVFLEGFHDTLNVPNYGREERPANTFALRVEKQGSLWFDGQSSQTQLADATVFLKYRLTNPSNRCGFASLWVAAVKIPTGEASHGFGSGSIDFGIYLPLQWNGRRWSYFLSPGVTWTGSPDDGMADVQVRNTVQLSGAILLAHDGRRHWVAQMDYHSSPLERTGIAQLDQGALQFTVGCRQILKKGRMLKLGFSEDLSGAVPDFTVRLGLTWTGVGQKW